MSRRTSRSIVALLALSLLLHAVTLLGGVGSTAYATVAAWIQDLGPAERLTLVSPAAEDGTAADPVVVRNARGRLAWGESPTARAWAIGTVNDRAIIAKYMTSDRLEESRAALREELTAQSAEYEARMQAIIGEVQGLDPEDERNGAVIEDASRRYAAIQQEYADWQQQAQSKGDRLEADALKQAYRDFVAAVDVVADRRGVDLVIRAVPADADFDNDTVNGVSSSLRMRTAVVAPEGLDLTEDVSDELGL